MTKTRRIRRSTRLKMVRMIIRFRGAGRIRRTRRAIRTKESEKLKNRKNRGAERSRKSYIFLRFRKVSKARKI